MITNEVTNSCAHNFNSLRTPLLQQKYEKIKSKAKKIIGVFFSDRKIKAIFVPAFFRGVAQPGLEYASGGRVVAGSNPVTPTIKVK